MKNLKFKHSLFICLSSGLFLTACNDDTDNRNSTTTPPQTTTSLYLQTKQPYLPQQKLSTYEAQPAGYQAVFTELVARHGSRGLSSIKYDLALYNMWLKAKQENALTPLGEKLGADLEAMMKANILLGYGVEGIRQYGYGNESSIGIKEHRGIADRLLQRLPDLFNQASQQGKTIQIVSSGVDRAVDSAKFFSNELLKQQPNLKSSITPASYQSLNSGSVPSIADGGVSRFNLYFHSLNAQDDLANIKTDLQKQIYDASLKYQEYEENDLSLKQKLKELSADNNAQKIATAVLTPIFKATFIQKLGQAGYTFSNTGSFTVTSPQGEQITEKGKGKNTITSAVDAAAYLYELYSITGGMQDELGTTDFSKYMPIDAAKFYAQYNDANDFYSKGPSFDAGKAITTEIAQSLKQDLFKQVDDVINKRQKNIAVLRFAHAEIIIPLATSLELKGMMQSVPFSQTFNYNNSTWRGEDISPMAANVQWDIYQNSQGQTLLKMLYNEKEISFKQECDYARYKTKSYYYDYLKLKQCYNIQ
ncbi:histidine-type phosphatase [Acinetobacter bereziniae]|uniref:histidine-type phosphatase n=1 Tax=Acinetobacter bereziniae TaxID=106648 RepID=UPI003019D15F